MIRVQANVVDNNIKFKQAISKLVFSGREHIFLRQKLNLKNTELYDLTNFNPFCFNQGYIRTNHFIVKCVMCV